LQQQWHSCSAHHLRAASGEGGRGVSGHARGGGGACGRVQERDMVAKLG
jgi:hypothetical protein